MVIATAAALVASGALAACGGNASVPRSPLSLADVAPAVAAVESGRGGPQRYTEINVGIGLVNLFVAVGDGTELAFVYRKGKLEDPGPAQASPAGSTTFALDEVSLGSVADFDRLLARQLPKSHLTTLALLDAPPLGLSWQAGMAGGKGSNFQVAISPTGQIVGALPGQS